MNTNGPGNGPGFIIGGWEGDWTQVVGFTFGRSPFLLFYRQSKQPTAFVAPVVRGPQSPINGTPVSIGHYRIATIALARTEIARRPLEE